MPYNFDEILQDDLTFVVRGETFTMDYVRPEVLAQWEDAEEAAEGDKAADTAEAAIERLDGRILAFLKPEDRERWQALRARTTDPIPWSQMKAIVRWMVEVQSQRPTETPSASAGGRGSTAASSTGASRSRGATRAA